MSVGYHGYWASNLDEVNPFFGAADDLRAVSAALHARGMCKCTVWAAAAEHFTVSPFPLCALACVADLMVDIVANHMGDGDISTFSPFSNESFYHDCSNCPSGEQHCQAALCSVGLPRG